MTVLVLVLKSSLILAAGLAGAALLTRRSAAFRHLVLVSALVAAGLMPLLAWVAPEWPVVTWAAAVNMGERSAVLGDATTSAVTQVDATLVSTEPLVSWVAVVIALWAAASLWVGARLIRGHVAIARLTRSATPVTGTPLAMLAGILAANGIRRRVRLLRVDTPSLVVAAGVWHPRVLVPRSAETWTDERWRIVLQHEVAHIRRLDPMFLLIGELVRLTQPFNPLVWMAARRLREESEHACDDEVLAAGVRPSDYASHLLDVARQFSSVHPAAIAASAIVHSSPLERRVTAMLNTRKNRRAVSTLSWGAAAVAAVAMSLPIAAANVVVVDVPHAVPPVFAPATPVPVASPAPAPVPTLPTVAPARRVVEQAPAVMDGRVVDQSGGVMPGATITLTPASGGNEHRAISNAMGRFSFTTLPAGTYELVASLSGFQTWRTTVALSAGQRLEPTVTLAIGMLTETVTIKCGPSSLGQMFGRLVDVVMPTVHAQNAPVRVGGQIVPPRKVTHVAPVCPAGANTPETTVLIAGEIDVEGQVVGAALVPGTAVTPEVAEAALTAVRQWRFSPTRLNGQPVPANITVTITFER